jgi:hypothetical protein
MLGSKVVLAKVPRLVIMTGIEMCETTECNTEVSETPATNNVDDSRFDRSQNTRAMSLTRA